MAFDYSNLFGDEKGLIDTWRDIYDDNLSVPENLLNLLPRFVLLPDDYYDIIAAYMLIPSALAKVVPYLFLYGQSGTGKSTLGKLISYFWGVPINTSGDTYASIRNSLNDRKYQDIEIPSKDPSFPSIYKTVEVNTGMVWDDIDSSVVLNTPYLFRMLKVGYDSSTDKISISSDIKGENLEFRCFSLKVFSSISPIHLEDSLKELQRRLIVIPFKRIEDLSDERLAQLGTTRDTWPKHLLNINAFDWKGFSSLFTNFWNPELAEVYLLNRKTLMNTLTGLSSKERAISLDLLSAGITSGIWPNEIQGVARLKNYFNWFDNEINQFSGISKYLKDYVAFEQENAQKTNSSLQISTRELHSQIDTWFNQGWILEKPKPKQVKALLADLGLVLYQGYWIKR